MYAEVSKWSDANRKINVRTNSDSPKDSIAARAFGAEAIFFVEQNICFSKEIEFGQ